MQLVHLNISQVPHAQVIILTFVLYIEAASVYIRLTILQLQLYTGTKTHVVVVTGKIYKF